MAAPTFPSECPSLEPESLILSQSGERLHAEYGRDTGLLSCIPPSCSSGQDAAPSPCAHSLSAGLPRMGLPLTGVLAVIHRDSFSAYMQLSRPSNPAVSDYYLCPCLGPCPGTRQTSRFSYNTSGWQTRASSFSFRAMLHLCLADSCAPFKGQVKVSQQKSCLLPSDKIPMPFSGLF